VSGDDALAAAAMEGRWEAAVRDEPTRALCRHALRLNRQPAKVGEPDLDELRRAGHDDRAILDLTLVVAYFNFVNRLASGLCVELEP
jgi:alkylhydroperoxidase family enzyme